MKHVDHNFLAIGCRNRQLGGHSPGWRFRASMVSHSLDKRGSEMGQTRTSSSTRLGLTGLAGIASTLLWLGGCTVTDSTSRLGESKAALGTAACLGRSVNELRLQFILLLDDAAGSNCTASNPCVTADDMTAFVSSANSTYAPGKIQFVYDKDLDFA